MVIIPSYDAGGQLNYFVSRSFISTANFTFKNPPVGRDVVGFDLMINWDEPIILVESAFDAIAIKRNAIPLFGKSIPKKLKRKIIEKNVREMNLCLDGDAYVDAINHSSYFTGNGIDVYITELTDEDDPSSLGYSEIWNRINNAVLFDKLTLFEEKIKNHINGNGKTYLSHRRRSLQTPTAAQRVSGSFQPNVSHHKGDRY